MGKRKPETSNNIKLIVPPFGVAGAVIFSALPWPVSGCVACWEHFYGDVCVYDSPPAAHFQVYNLREPFFIAIFFAYAILSPISQFQGAQAAGIVFYGDVRM